MNDPEIRAALVRRLDGQGGLLIHELGLSGHRHRADVVTVDTELCGFEIKGDGDTLRRLPAQAAAFSRVFDRVTLVSAERHVARALDIVPPWWAVLVAGEGERGVFLEPCRTGAINPAPDPVAVAEVLWRDQALAALRRRGLARGHSRSTCRVLSRALATGVPLDELRAEARTALVAQRQWIARGKRGDKP